MPSIIVLAALALAAAVFVLFVVICLAIRREDNSPRLTTQAPTAGTAATRRVSGLCVRRPAASPASQPGPEVALWDAPSPPSPGPEGR